MSSGRLYKTLDDFFERKSDHTLALFEYFVSGFREIGIITLHPARTMIGVANDERRIAWITQLGRNFIHVVFPFKMPYPENLCFTKIAQVPGRAEQYNHHFRMYYKEDLNEEIIQFMKQAYAGV